MDPFESLPKAPPKIRKVAEVSAENSIDFSKPRRGSVSLSVDLMRIDRLPPHALEAEQGVIGSILLEPTASFDLCIEKMHDGELSFYDLRHQCLYGKLLEMWDARERIDIITVQQKLKDAGVLDGVGGLAYLSSLMDSVPSAANLSYYLDIVCEKLTLRKLLKSCTQVVATIHEHSGPASTLVDEVEREISAIRGGGDSKQTKPIKELVRDSISAIERWHQKQGQLGGIPTGLSDLDKLTDGLHGGELIVIAARPSIGKTSLAMNIVEHATVDLGVPSGVFSLEMTADSLTTRMLCSRARLNMKSVQQGFLTELDFKKLTACSGKIARSSLIIDDTSGIPIQQLRARARRMQQRHGVKMIVVDYLQLVTSPSSRKSDTRQQEVSEVSAGLKAMAKELNVPVVALCQLNRDLEKRGNGATPRLSDIKESGCLSGETVVYCPNQNSRIDSLNVDADGFAVHSVGMTNKTIHAEPSKVWSTGKKKVFLLTLSTGHSIKATANHKFFGLGDKWFQLKELNAGDMIAIPMNAASGMYSTLSMAEARLLGLFVSNGCALPRRSIQITVNSNDRDLVSKMINDAEAVFGGKLRPHFKLETHKTRPGHSWIQVFFPSKKVPSKIHRSVLVEWLEKHAIYGKRAKEKIVPPEIFKQPKPIIREFLSALFSGDGTCGIATDKNNPKKHQYNVASYSSSSRRLCDEVQWLLQCCGIVSGISDVTTRGFTTSMLSVYSRTNKLKFAETIGFLGSRKDAIMRETVQAMMKAPMGYEKYTPNGDLTFVPIKSIKEVGEEKVWDMEVPATNNFVANGIMVHNSVEQDADVVAMLYRTNEGDDAESDSVAVNVLIAKQRNGPAGVEVPLIFRKSLTRFEQASPIKE